MNKRSLAFVCGILLAAPDAAPRRRAGLAHVALIGGTGTSQLFDCAANAYRAGTGDDDTLARLAGQRRALGRDVTFRRVPRAGHGLVPEGGTMADTQKEYDAIMAWFERR
jgi:hypothetical protein